MTTYPEMNEQIVKLLRLSNDPIKLYAAARIEELEAQLNAEGDQSQFEPIQTSRFYDDSLV